jgi:tagaturonate reductase
MTSIGWTSLGDKQITVQQLVEAVLSDSDHWGQDLTQVAGLVAKVSEDLQVILSQGMRAAVARYC